MPTAVVTGATGGVGRAVAAQLLDKGWTVYALSRQHDARLDGESQPHWVHVDLTAPEAVAPDLDACPDLDKLDALVHCAGYCRLSTAANAPASDWLRTFDINVYAPAALTSHYLPALREARGSVVYINSGAGLHVHPGWSVYSASKHAARAWCDGLRAEEPDIRVCSVYPGRIDTTMQRQVVAQEGGTYMPGEYLTPETVARAVLAALRSPIDAHVTDITLRPQPASFRTHGGYGSAD